TSGSSATPCRGSRSRSPRSRPMRWTTSRASCTSAASRSTGMPCATATCTWSSGTGCAPPSRVLRMPARNRVTPYGDIEALPWRGAWTGNRGILHEGRDIVRFHGHDAWITCVLRLGDRHHEQWVAHHYTWLYFLDEAVSFAAGHRPCAFCRRPDYDRFRAAWTDAAGGEAPSARE